jgi:ferredoxin
VFEVNSSTGFNEAGEFQAPEAVRASALAGANACPEHAITVLTPDPGR